MEEALLSDKVPHEWGEVSEEKIWSNLEYFLKAVIPVAEKAGVRSNRGRRSLARACP